MFKCYYCGQTTVSMESDFSFEDICLEGEGVVQCFYCRNCGAHIEFYVRFDDPDMETEDE